MSAEVADAAWAAQVGPALVEADVARLLGRSPQAVSDDPRLLRIVDRTGRSVYPIVQFDDGQQLAGVGDAVALLSRSLLPLTIASWLTAPNRALANRTPIQALLAGDDDAVRVVAARLAAMTDH